MKNLDKKENYERDQRQEVARKKDEMPKLTKSKMIQKKAWKRLRL